MKKTYTNLVVTFAGLCLAIVAQVHAQDSPKPGSLPQGFGLSRQYPQDRGIDKDPQVVFVESFEDRTLDGLKKRWEDVSNDKGKVLAFSDLVPSGASGKTSIQMTATRGQDNGGHLFRRLLPGYDTLFVRFYVRFAADHGFIHHFVTLGGMKNPPAWPTGDAGFRPVDRFSSGIEPVSQSQQFVPPRSFDPPGIWHFYTYWPRMRTWQNDTGDGDSYYGNDFEPLEPVQIPRDRWICVEIAMGVNKATDQSDGWQCFWIDGKPVEWFGPGHPNGRWQRDKWLIRDDAKAAGFPGFLWRTDSEIKLNRFWLMHYVTEKAFAENDAYAAKHPDIPINTKTATVWFDDIIIARSYIGPICPGTGTDAGGIANPPDTK